MKKKPKVALLVIALIIVVAHFMGFKIFGSATLVKNQPLKNPQKMSDITKEGTIVLGNDKEYGIYGIITILPNPLEQVRYFKQQIPTLEIEIESPEKATSKVWAKHRLIYWCGNTWMSRPFPPRLPAYSKADLAEILVRYGGAIPNVSVFKESPEYANELMEALSRQVSDLDIQQNSESAIRLGRYLISSQPKYFREGAWLLAHNNKSEIFDAVAKEVKKKINKRPGFCSIDTRQEIIDYSYILMKLSEDKAKQFLLGQIQRNIYDYLRVHMATVLLSVDDCSGYDILMDETIKSQNVNLSHKMDRFLSNSSPGKYYPRENTQAMYLWYQKNKNKLHWDKKGHMRIKEEL